MGPQIIRHILYCRDIVTLLICKKHILIKVTHCRLEPQHFHLLQWSSPGLNQLEKIFRETCSLFNQSFTCFAMKNEQKSQSLYVKSSKRLPKRLGPVYNFSFPLTIIHYLVLVYNIKEYIQFNGCNGTKGE